MHEYGVITSDLMPDNQKYDAVVLAVSHAQFANLDLAGLQNEKCVVYDVKGFLPVHKVDERL
jgi:UDP-N-acetyl-D-galactosamine dehydrogenase